MDSPAETWRSSPSRRRGWPSSWNNCSASREGTRPDSNPSTRPDPFASFWPANSTGTSTGLGLSVVRSLVADHGGSLEVMDGSALGLSGAAFIVRLPVLDEPPCTVDGVRTEGSEA